MLTRRTVTSTPASSNSVAIFCRRISITFTLRLPLKIPDIKFTMSPEEIYNKELVSSRIDEAYLELLLPILFGDETQKVPGVEVLHWSNPGVL